jgi:hypothetical protein
VAVTAGKVNPTSIIAVWFVFLAAVINVDLFTPTANSDHRSRDTPTQVYI